MSRINLMLSWVQHEKGVKTWSLSIHPVISEPLFYSQPIDKDQLFPHVDSEHGWKLKIQNPEL